MQKMIQNICNADHAILYFLTANVLPIFLPSRVLREKCSESHIYLFSILNRLSHNVQKLDSKENKWFHFDRDFQGHKSGSALCHSY